PGRIRADASIRQAPFRPNANSNIPAPAPPFSQLQRVEFLRRMEKQLDLSPDQTQRIERVMRKSQDRTRPIYEQIAPQMRQELHRVREEIRAELTPEQLRKFNDLLKAHPRNPNSTNGPARVTATN